MDKFFSCLIQQFWIFLQNILAVAIFCPFLKKKQNIKRNRLIVLGVFCIVLIACTFFQYFLGDNAFTATYLLLTASLFAFLVVCYEGKPLNYIFYFFSGLMLSLCLNSIRGLFLTFNYLGEPFSSVILPNNWLDYLLTFLCMTLLYGGVYFGFARKLYGNQDVVFEKSILVIYLLSSCACPFFGWSIAEIKQLYPHIVIFLYLIFIFYMLSMLYVQYVVYAKKVKELELINEQTENEAIKRLSRETYEIYSSLKVNMDEINVKCHDLKHRFFEAGLPNNQWSNELLSSIDIYDRTIKTGNEELDSVLMYHSMLCQRKQIQFACVADGSKISVLELADMYTLFGNAISNACEYLETLDEEKRFIRMYIKVVNCFMFIHIENYFEGELTLKDGLPSTVKEDKSNHGFGMKSMKMIAEKYGGSLEVKAADKLFQLNILIPVE